MPLRLKRRPGSPNWHLAGTVRGQAVRESTGTADRAVAEQIRIKREGELLTASIHGRAAVATFAEAVVSYLEGGGEGRFVGRLLDHFGATPLGKIGQAEIDAAARRLYPGRKPGTINRQVYTPMSAILTHAAARGLTTRRTMTRPRQPAGKTRWLRPDEAARLVDACAPHMRPLVVFLLYTGARLSEALYLDWREVDLSLCRAQFLDTKNGRPRGVPLHPEAVAALANLQHRDGAVFRRPDGLPYADKGEGGGQIKTGFRAACRRAGLAGVTPHTLRHTWASWHYAANRDLLALMEVGGWHSLEMVKRYAHLNPDQHAPGVGAIPMMRRKA